MAFTSISRVVLDRFTPGMLTSRLLRRLLRLLIKIIALSSKCELTCRMFCIPASKFGCWVLTDGMLYDLHGIEEAALLQSGRHDLNGQRGPQVDVLVDCVSFPYSQSMYCTLRISIKVTYIIPDLLYPKMKGGSHSPRLGGPLPQAYGLVSSQRDSPATQSYLYS